MARPREFEMGAAIDGAMNAFWRFGYSATNLPALLRAMGLSRGSFYKAFGDKHAAYLAALDHYERKNIAAAAALLTDSEQGGGFERILALFQLAQEDRQETARGCFVCNAMVEVAPKDEQVADKTLCMTRKLEDALFDAISDIDELKPLDAAARRRKAAIVTRFYIGSKATGKTGRDNQDWAALLRDILNLSV